MMGYGNWGGYNMMNSGFGILMTFFWLVILIDLIHWEFGFGNRSRKNKLFEKDEMNREHARVSYKN